MPVENEITAKIDKWGGIDEITVKTSDPEFFITVHTRLLQRRRELEPKPTPKKPDPNNTSNQI